MMCVSRFFWLGLHPGSWAWWGSVIFCLGSIQYNIASTSTFAHNFPPQHAAWSARKVKWLCTVMYTSGGAAYFLAGACYVVKDTGPWIWRGVTSSAISPARANQLLPCSETCSI